MQVSWEDCDNSKVIAIYIDNPPVGCASYASLSVIGAGRYELEKQKYNGTSDLYRGSLGRADNIPGVSLERRRNDGMSVQYFYFIIVMDRSCQAFLKICASRLH